MATVFVGNLSPEVTDSDLRAVFQEYGKVGSLRLMSRRRSAFVELSPEAANAAVEALRGAELKGRTVDVALERGSGGRPGKRSNRGRSRRR
jgi:RNA recognition motif-containing protein